MGELLDYLVGSEESFRRARLPALYSDFRAQRTLNPDGYQANVAAWSRGLANGTLAGHGEPSASTPSLLVLKTGPGLIRSLESKQHGRPLALGAVLREAVRDGAMMPLGQFMSRNDSVYGKPSASSSWGSVPNSLLSWGLRQLGFGDDPSGGGEEDRLPEGSFVLIANLEVASKAFEARASSSSTTSPFERTFSKAHFEKSFSGLLPGRRLSEADFEVLFKFLARDKAILAYDGHVVRIKSKPSDPSAITQEDSAIASLRELIADLTHQAAVLSSRVDDLSAKAREAVAEKKNRVAALAVLKSKKMAENLLQTRYDTLSKLEAVAHKLEQAADQVQLVAVMKSSSAALKSLNARTGGVDKVAEVLDDLREQMGEVDEIGTMLADVGSGTAVVDEAEIDDELEALVNEDRERKEEEERKRKALEDNEREQQKAKELENMFSGAELPPTLLSGDELKKANEGKAERETAQKTIEELRGLEDIAKEQPQPT